MDVIFKTALIYKIQDVNNDLLNLSFTCMLHKTLLVQVDTESGTLYFWNVFLAQVMV